MANLEVLLPLTNPDFHRGTHVQVEVRYNKGGQCFATYKNMPRGYYLSVGLIGIGENTRCFGLFSHPTTLIESAKRLNQKRLDQLWHSVKNDLTANSGLVCDMIREVLAKHGRSLVESESASV